MKKALLNQEKDKKSFWDTRDKTTSLKPKRRKNLNVKVKKAKEIPRSYEDKEKTQLEDQ